MNPNELRRVRIIHGPGMAAVAGIMVHFADGAEFAAQYEQFFETEILRGIRRPADRTPVLIDVGANIGTCTLWFKKKFPDSRVVAIEPDPALVPLLLKNMSAFFDVKVVPAAAWHSEGRMELHTDGVCGSRLSEIGDAASNLPIAIVPTIDVLRIIPNYVTLLKIDIEGSELEVLRRLRTRLGRSIDYIHIEVHEIVGTPRRLLQVLSILTDAGYDYHIAPLHTDPHPYELRLTWRGVLNPVAVFAWQQQLASPIVDVAESNNLRAEFQDSYTSLILSRVCRGGPKSSF